MANWAYKVDLKEILKSYPNELNIQEVSEQVSEKLIQLIEEIRKEPELDISIHGVYRSEFLELADELEEEILPQFQEIAESDEFDEDDFDYAMSDLYDWGDTSLDNKFGGVKMCWINSL